MGDFYKKCEEEKCPDSCGCPIKLDAECVILPDGTTLLDYVESQNQGTQEIDIALINTLIANWFTQNGCELVQDCTGGGCVNPPTLENFTYNCDTSLFEVEATNYEMIIYHLVDESDGVNVEVVFAEGVPVELDPTKITEVKVISNQGCPTLVVPVSLACGCDKPTDLGFGYNCDTNRIFTGSPEVSHIEIVGQGSFSDGDYVNLVDGTYDVIIHFNDGICLPLETTLDVDCTLDFTLTSAVSIECVGSEVILTGTYTTGSTLPLMVSGVAGMSYQISGGNFEIHYPSPSVSSTDTFIISNSEIYYELTVTSPVCVEQIANPGINYNCELEIVTISGENISQAILTDSSGSVTVVNGQQITLESGTYDVTYIPINPLADNVTSVVGLEVSCGEPNVVFSFDVTFPIKVSCNPLPCSREVFVKIFHTEPIDVELIQLPSELVVGVINVIPNASGESVVSIEVGCSSEGLHVFRVVGYPELISGEILLTPERCLGIPD